MIRIAGDPFLQNLLQMRKRAVMDFTLLDRCFLAIRPQTWKRVNDVLGRRAVEEEVVKPASCPHRFQDRKVKRLHLHVTRYMPSMSRQ